MKRLFPAAVAGLIAFALVLGAESSAFAGQTAGGPPSPSVTGVATGVRTAAPTATMDLLPLPGEGPDDSFFTDKETVTVSSKKDHWRYTSQVLYVDIRKVQVKKKKLTYFVADIRFRDASQFRSAVIKGKQIPEVIARQFSAVYAQNGDFYTLEKKLKGIIIRNGKVLSERKGADTLAILPDGTLKIYSPGETTAKKLLAKGVTNTWSFGPTLIRDGVMRTNYNRFRNHGRNPRSGFGMIEPGHYIGIVVSGRSPGYSVGVNYLEFAKLFQFYGCKQAYSLDGGASASMVFMGRPMDLRIHMTGSSRVTKRRVPDLFIIGKSNLVAK